MDKMNRVKKISRDRRVASSFSTQAPTKRSEVTLNTVKRQQTSSITGAAAGMAAAVPATMASIQTTAAKAAESASP